MPGIKATIYDGAIAVNNAKALDVSGIGPVVAQYTAINYAAGYNVGAKSLVVDTQTSDDATANFSVGDKLLDSLTHRAIGTIDTVAANLITLKNGSHIPLADDAVLEKWKPYEIVAIQCVEAAVLPVLVPITNKWPGTVASDGGTWAAHSDFQVSSTAAYAGTALEADMVMAAGTTIEGRWKRVTTTSADAIICYLKAAPTQTF